MRLEQFEDSFASRLHQRRLRGLPFGALGAGARTNGQWWLQREPVETVRPEREEERQLPNIRERRTAKQLDRRAPLEGGEGQ